MKFNKKTAMLISFTLGTLLVATTALADIANKSGYDQLKDALKVTAEQGSEKFDSFTLDFSIALMDNGKTLMTSNEIKKYDRLKGASETISTGESLNGDKNNYQYYADKTTQIRVSESDPTIYVTEYAKPREGEVFNNPFKEDEAADLEKILDAIVGSLKDYVVVVENSDASKELEGKLTGSQIPALVNAVASYSLKQEFNGNQSNMPHLTKDVYVNSVSGKANVNKDGVMESILGTAVLSGKNEQGTDHDVTVEILVKLSGINTTTVTKPDLTGKKVVKNIARETPGDEIANPEMFVGKFNNNILIEKDNKFIKIGERIIEITQIDNMTITGRYYEEYKPGFEEYATPDRKFKLDGKKPEQKNYSGFDYTTESGIKGNLYIDEYGGKIHLNMNTSMGGLHDSTFSPDVE